MNSIFNIFIVLGCISYLKAIFTNPGYIPQYLLLDPYAANPICPMCNFKRPPRANHCHACNKCVMRLEHHCPWINNCIGYNNFKSYFLMLFYLSLSGIYYTVTLIYLVFFDYDTAINIPRFIYAIYLFTGLIYVSFSVTLAGFTGLYIIHLYYGVTAYERLKDIDWAEPFTKCDWSNLKGNSPYNLDWVKNFERMFGNSILLWFIPINSNKTTQLGYEFDTIPHQIKEINELQKESKIDYLEEVNKKYENCEILYDDLLEINKHL